MGTSCYKVLSDGFCQLPVQSRPRAIKSVQLPACCCSSPLAAFAWCAHLFVMLASCHLMPIAAYRRDAPNACCICAEPGLLLTLLDLMLPCTLGESTTRLVRFCVRWACETSASIASKQIESLLSHLLTLSAQSSLRSKALAKNLRRLVFSLN